MLNWKEIEDRREELEAKENLTLSEKIELYATICDHAGFETILENTSCEHNNYFLVREVSSEKVVAIRFFTTDSFDSDFEYTVKDNNDSRSDIDFGLSVYPDFADEPS